MPKIIVEGSDPGERPVSLAPLRRHEATGNPLGDDFNYAEAFSRLDFEQVKADLRAILRQSREFWPADYGHYGPLFIRLSWHSAGTYRAIDGRGGADGGQMRFYPLAQWPDNANLDKARLLIQPVVDKYYPNLSWADAMVLAGDIAMQDMGFKTLGVAGGRIDDFAPDMVYWGPEDEFLQSERFGEDGRLMLPLAASVMGLIYVNPEGADGRPDPRASAEHIRITFGRMGMNDEETVALIAGGHTFGKAHGAPRPPGCQGKGARRDCPPPTGPNANTSGLEGPWTSKPIEWTHEYLTNLYKYEWELQRGPGGKYQWFARDLEESDMAPDAHDARRKVPLMMLTTDLALRHDATYDGIARRFLANPQQFADAFARAWFKLIHRDLGPKSRYLGNDFPAEDFLWQDPVPTPRHDLINEREVRRLKRLIAESQLSVADRIKTAWAAAASFRGTDMRGGANGARLQLAPQNGWEVNEPQRLAANLQVLRGIQEAFNARQRRRPVSLADLIVLAGNTAVEEAARRAGYEIEIPFTPGRTDASQAQTDVGSFSLLKVTADGFRNYYDAGENYLEANRAFIERADFLTLTPKEMTVLTGGLRVLGANHNNVDYGVFTRREGVLTNDFFINLLDSSTKWVRSAGGIFIGQDRSSGENRWRATEQDLLFGTNAELRMIAFAYSSHNARRQFVADFVHAWEKVMSLDRFDLENR